VLIFGNLFHIHLKVEVNHLFTRLDRKQRMRLTQSHLTARLVVACNRLPSPQQFACVVRLPARALQYQKRTGN